MGALAACGARTIPLGDGGTGGTDPGGTGSGTVGTGTGSGTTSGPECVDDSDCAYGEYCTGGECEYDPCSWGCCQHPPPGDPRPRCSPPPYYDCYGDSDCEPLAMCQTWGGFGGYCTDVAALPACEGGAKLLPIPVPMDVPAEILTMAVIDADGDPQRDLLLGASNGLYVVRGATGIVELVPGTSTSGVVGVAAGDVDGDGDEDLFVAQASTQGTVLVSDGAGGFTGAAVLDVVGASVVLADLNSDGQRDVVYTSALSADLQVAYGAGAGMLEVPVWTGITLWSAIRRHELGGMLPDELFIAGDGGVQILTGDAPVVPVWALSWVAPTSAAAPVRLAGGTAGDFAVSRSVAGWSWTHFQAYAVTNGAPAIAQEFGTLGGYTRLEAADLDGDGIPELVAAGAGQPLLVFEASVMGAGMACAGASDTTTADLLVAADVDGDGRDEIGAITAAGLVLYER